VLRLLAACLVALALWTAGPARAEMRAALVVANGAYSGDLAALPNPVNDGKVIAAALERVGFSVTLVTDADQAEMRNAIKGFGKSLEAAGDGAVALFYYAGHGMQVGGMNYLVPVGAAIEREEDADLEAIPAESVLHQMEYAGTSVNIVILDACRNNPLARGTVSGGAGLARMDAPTGSFVAYSTAPGDLAVDGAGSNSPFAQALSTELQVPNLAIEEVFRRVRVKVKSETKDRQVPWDSSSLTSSFAFNPVGLTDADASAAAPRWTTAEMKVGKTGIERNGERQGSDSDGVNQASVDAAQMAALGRQLRPRADILDAIDATPLFRGFPRSGNYRADLRYQFVEPDRSIAENLEVKALSGNLAVVRRETVEVKSWNTVPEAYRLENAEEEVAVGPLALTRLSSSTIETPRGIEKSSAGGRISALRATEGYLFPMRSGAWTDLTYAFEEPGGQPREVNLFAEVTESVPCEKIHTTLSGRCFNVEITTRLVYGTETSYRNLVFVEDLAAFIPFGEFGSHGVAEGHVELMLLERLP
jgi:hypothetical protein